MKDAVVSQNLSLLNSLSRERRGDIAGLVKPQTVAIHTSARALYSRNGQWILSLTSNLLARMAPLVRHVYLEIEEDAQLLKPTPMLRGTTIGDSVLGLADEINCGVTFSVCRPGRQKADLRISVGRVGAESQVQVASDGWLAFLNTCTDPGPNENPVGANLAACLALSEAFKFLLKNLGLIGALKRPVVFRRSVLFSAYDYSVDKADAENPSIPSEFNVGPLLVAGVGSGGSATILTLSAIPGIIGRFALVDPDEIIGRNLQRYPFATLRHANEATKKVRIAAALLGCGSGRECLVEEKPYKACVEEFRRRGFLDLVVATVHTGAARRGIQKDLPRVLLDGAVTENGEAVIRRVFFGESACMGCFYPQTSIYEETKVMAQGLGLETSEVQELMATNGKFSPDQVRRVSGRINAPPTVGERWGDWRQKCAELPLFVEDRSTEIPAAFATTVAGVLIAGEVMKERLFPNAVLKSYYVLDTLGTFSPAYPYLRRPSDGCDICGDADAHEVFRSRYSQ
ncbi:MAG: hypothetical protein ACE145_09625 [Terriglobia bacterium]